MRMGRSRGRKDRQKHCKSGSITGSYGRVTLSPALFEFKLQTILEVYIKQTEPTAY